MWLLTFSFFVLLSMSCLCNNGKVTGQTPHLRDHVVPNDQLLKPPNTDKTPHTRRELDAEAKLLRLGYLVPVTGPEKMGQKMAAAVAIRIDELNGTPLMEDWRFEYYLRDSGCSPGKALKELTFLLADGIDVLVGPGCSVACGPTQLLLSSMNLPQV